MATTFIDRAADWALQRYFTVRARVSRQDASLPAYMAIDAESAYGRQWANMDDWETQVVGLRISWVYAAIDLLARQFAASQLRIVRGTEDPEIYGGFNPFSKPNEFMSRTYLLRYILYWLSLSRRGAFIFMAPASDNLQRIVELWPMNSNRVEVVPGKTELVKHYLYYPQHGEKPVEIDPRYVMWFRYPDPHNYYASLPPLLAMMDAMKIELGLVSSQEKIYTRSRGVPLAVVSTDPDISDKDFEVVRATIRRDWENDNSTIAITKGGTIDIKSIGFSQKDMEILGNQKLTRDRIDVAIFGFAIHSESYASGEALKVIDKLITDKTVWPLHVMVAETITDQMLNRFWPTTLRARFDDVRAQDRAIVVQEQQLALRWKTVNEMRKEQDMPPVEEIDDEKPLGNLLVPLATNPSFVLKYWEIGESNPAQVPGEPDFGNMVDQLDPERVVDDLAEQAKSWAAIEEIKRWRKVYRKGGDRWKTFEREFIPGELFRSIVKRIDDGEDGEEVFSEWLDLS